MIRLGILDANNPAAAEYRGVVASVIGQWIEWEASRKDVQLVEPCDADVVFLAFAGGVGWAQACTRELKRAGILPSPHARQAGRRGGERGCPYLLAGGPVDANPLTALALADGLAVGEAYGLVRAVLDLASQGRSIVSDVERLIADHPHAIARTQTAGLQRDPSAPWLLAEQPEPLASPDPYVDWTAPAVKTDDKVVRVIGSKGCHFKCSYCATTFRQAYTGNPSPGRIRTLVKRLHRAGERIQVLSNDPANLPWYPALQRHLDHGSYTIEEFLRPENRAAIMRQRPKIVRFGVEGLSERLRFAWNKPIPDQTVLDVIADLDAAKINSHLFMIVAAPFEGEPDWQAWREFMRRLVRIKVHGITRIKFTSYQPSPPAPLTRFVSGAEFEGRFDAFRNWYLRNEVSNHVLLINPRRSKTRSKDVAEQLQIPVELARDLVTGEATTDLAPSLEAFQRFPHEIIEWPIAARARFRMSETFLDRVHSEKPLPKVATVARTLGRRRR